MFRTTFSVTSAQGRYFPIDMLRYDACFPASETDSGKIEACLSRHLGEAKLPINLEKFHPDRQPHVTDARWRSFGWMIVNGSVQTEKR